MGFPFPYPDDPGAPCGLCKHLFPDLITPLYLYAKIDDVVICPLSPPGLPDVNGVHRLEQDAIVPCIWLLQIMTGWGLLIYELDWIPLNSVFSAGIAGGLSLFGNWTGANCTEFFANQNICGVTPFAAGHGGTAEIFWGP